MVPDKNFSTKEMGAVRKITTQLGTFKVESFGARRNAGPGRTSFAPPLLSRTAMDNKATKCNEIICSFIARGAIASEWIDIHICI